MWAAIARERDRHRPPARDPRHDWYAAECPCGVAAGECREHPRARPNQRPPAGDWRTWMYLSGRGGGKTRAGAEWVRWLAESGAARRIALVAPTAADARDVMVEGESGILAVCPDPGPDYEPTKRRLTWPNGAIATTYSAEEPKRLRGPQHDAAWLDECGCWDRADAYDMLLFGLRLGSHPRACVTTTPRPSRLIRSILADPLTATVKGTTFDNRPHLAPTFFDQIVATYQGTRLGQQEIYAEVLDVSEGAWFATFDPIRHVGLDAEYGPRRPVHLAIDAGSSTHTAAVWFQVREDAGPHRRRVTVFGDYHCEGRYSEANARAIRAHSEGLPSAGRLDTARIDPASSARSGMGPAAYGEYERVFGPRILDRWPNHRVADGLDQLEVLLDKGDLILHPRCTHLKAAFQNYVRRQSSTGEWLDEPVDPQHPHEDVMDALRGGVRDRFPEGRTPGPDLRSVRADGFV